MEQVPGKLSEMLPPEPASVRRARHLVASAITASRHDELVETATLLVSEVVTNSVLHAGTEIRLNCRADRTGVRVEVFDRSPLSPSVRHYDAEAMTGRGLALVSVLATAWGVDLEGDGKTVWFELGTVEAEDEAPTPAVAAEAAQNPAPTLEIRLPAASPPLVKATIEHGDALLRELALLALGGELDDALADGWQLPQFDVSPILAAVESAGAQAKADLEVHFPAGAHATATERLRLIERADTLAREGRLFTAPALPEVAVCRHWLYTQIAEQAAGFPSAGWELPEPLKPARVAARLPARSSSASRRRRRQRSSLTTPTGSSSSTRAAGELLGWEPAALVGQRLTVLIPPELREAHLAGFSRLQVTGEPHILDSVVQVPALRRDGSSVVVALLIEQLVGPDGRRAFRGVLTPATKDSRDRGLTP